MAVKPGLHLAPLSIRAGMTLRSRRLRGQMPSECQASPHHVGTNIEATSFRHNEIQPRQIITPDVGARTGGLVNAEEQYRKHIVLGRTATCTHNSSREARSWKTPSGRVVRALSCKSLPVSRETQGIERSSRAWFQRSRHGETHDFDGVKRTCKGRHRVMHFAPNSVKVVLVIALRVPRYAKVKRISYSAFISPATVDVLGNCVAGECG